MLVWHWLPLPGGRPSAVFYFDVVSDICFKMFFDNEGRHCLQLPRLGWFYYPKFFPCCICCIVIINCLFCVFLFVVVIWGLVLFMSHNCLLIFILLAVHPPWSPTRGVPYQTPRPYKENIAAQEDPFPNLETCIYMR